MHEFGVLGHNISHSLSPTLHRMLGDYSYNLFDLDEDDAISFIKSKDFKGINITIPYKKLAFELADLRSEEALKIGACNTLINENGKLIAHNTDYHGFKIMLTDFVEQNLQLNIDELEDKKILILGDGGASKAVQAVLKDINANVVVISRKGKHTYSELEDGVHTDAFLLINTTPVGMIPHAPQAPLNKTAFDILTNLKGVLDLIYNPQTTLLGFWAQERDIAYSSGLMMLVEQAIEASRLFQTLPCTRIQNSKEIVNSLSAISRNIVLIGMPSAGKTSCAKHLSELSNRPWVDTDILFEERYNLSPEKYIMQYGEEDFREKESHIVYEVSQLNGHIISCGGGIVCKQQNYYPLRQNSTIVYLRRPLEELCDSMRPLTKKYGIENLYKERRNLYKKFANYEVDVEESPQKTAEAIATHLRI